MSTRIFPTDTRNLPPITQPELVDYFQKAARPRDQWKFGAEFEKIAIDRHSGHQLPYFGPHGIGNLLTTMADRFGWRSFREGDHVVALERDGGMITIEPGGQLELSSKLHTHMSGLEAELLQHRDEMWACVDPGKVAWLALGVTPFDRAEEIVPMPKGRYDIMAAFLPPRGPMAHHMMRCTASVQASFDFESEADAVKKLLTAISLSPFVNAIFGNAPLYGGKLTGDVSFRGEIWLGMDPDRSGFLKDVARFGELSFQRWVDYLLDVPMMFYCIDDVFTPAHGRTFRDYMATGHNGHLPTLEDWEMHLTSVFPEVRIKKYVEIRGADCVRPDLSLSVPALWKGIMYDEEALEAAFQLASTIPGEDRSRLSQRACREGLEADYRGRTIAAWAGEILDIAAEGLKRQAVASGTEDEGRYLDPARAVLAKRKAPGAELIELWPSLGGDPAKLAEAVAY